MDIVEGKLLPVRRDGQKAENSLNTYVTEDTSSIKLLQVLPQRRDEQLYNEKNTIYNITTSDGELSISEQKLYGKRRDGQIGTDTSITALEFYIAPAPTPSITPSISVTPSRTPSISFSRTPSITPSISLSRTPSITPSISLSSTPSITPSITPTRLLGSPSVTPSITPSTSLSRTPSITPSISLSRTPSVTPSVSFSRTPSATPSVSFSRTPSVTPSMSFSRTPSVTPTRPAASPSRTPSVTPSMSISRTPSVTPSRTPSTSPPQTAWIYYVDMYTCVYPFCEGYIGSGYISNTNSLSVGDFYCAGDIVYEIKNYTSGTPDYYTNIPSYAGYGTCNEACQDCSS